MKVLPGISACLLVWILIQGCTGQSDSPSGSVGVLPAQATCSGSSPTWIATNNSRPEVAACVAAASNGDTINVPAGHGTVTWTSGITIHNKTVHLVFPGPSNLTIMSTGSFGFKLTREVGGENASTIEGFKIDTSRGGTAISINSDGGASPQGWRIHHCELVSPTGAHHDMITGFGNTESMVTGLIDHCIISRGRYVHFGQGDNGAGTYGRARWGTEPLDLGTANAVYFEDCLFIQANGEELLNVIDSNYGSRTVVRFSSFDQARIEQHGIQGTHRGVRMWEFYYNNFDDSGPSSSFRPFFIRGGTGMMFHNQVHNYENNEITLNNARTDQWSTDAQYNAQIAYLGPCDGSSFADGNVATYEGWPCLDQIGRGGDVADWNYGNPHPGQTSFPAYIFRNTDPGLGNAELATFISCVGIAETCTRVRTKHILESRDFYTYRSSFDGTAGVGEGTLANRPSTCTTGVGYWATDQGSWNTSTSNPYGVQANGANGVLYHCASTNNWTVLYTPYPYPHPLQGRS